MDVLGSINHLFNGLLRNRLEILDQVDDAIVVGFFRFIVTDLQISSGAPHIPPCDHSLSCWYPAY